MCVCVCVCVGKLEILLSGNMLTPRTLRRSPFPRENENFETNGRSIFLSLDIVDTCLTFNEEERRKKEKFDQR